MNKAMAHLSKDHILKQVIESNELPTVARSAEGDVYAALIRSLVGQQLSVKAAETIYNRLVEMLKSESPEPAKIIATADEEFRSVGLSRQKIGYIRNIALAFQENKAWLSKDVKFWDEYSDEEVIAKLSAIKGVGKWTVQMILMFSLERPDVFPVDDLGVKNAMLKLYGFEGTPKETKNWMLHKAQEWQPYRTLASRYLWSHLNNSPK